MAANRHESLKGGVSKTAPGNLVVSAIKENPNAFKPLIAALNSVNGKGER
jgi:hypothetical protein